MWFAAGLGFAIAYLGHRHWGEARWRRSLIVSAAIFSLLFGSAVIALAVGVFSEENRLTSFKGAHGTSALWLIAATALAGLLQFSFGIFLFRRPRGSAV
jgi:hypothetical protein